MSDQSKPKVPVLAGGSVRAIIPQSLDECFRLASAFVAGGIAPRGMQRPEQVMVAIMAGAEVGLTPLQSVAGIWVSNGRPNLYGDALVAVVRASGQCRYIKTWIEGSGEAIVAWAETHRVGEPEPQRQSYSWAMAKRAGLTGKEGPWQTAPARMLVFRAKNFLLRDVYADVLRGLGGDETTEPEPIDVGSITPHDEETPPDPGINRDETVNEAASESEPAAVSDELPPDPDALPEKARENAPSDNGAELDDLLGALDVQLKPAKTVEEIDEVISDLDVFAQLEGDEDRQATANTIIAKHAKRVAKAVKAAKP